MHNQFSTWIEGELPLVRMMVHSSSAATRLQTYAWIENLDHPLPGKDPALPKERPPEDTQMSQYHPNLTTTKAVVKEQKSCTKVTNRKGMGTNP